MIQYYKIKKTGESYALDKATGKASKVGAIPTGGATITWGGKNLPSELQNVATTPKKPTPTYTPTAPTKPFDKYDFAKQMASMPAPDQTPQPEDLPQGLDQIGTFDRQLQFGSTGEDVKRLQQFLNQSGYIVAKEGAGSIGNETEYFGPATQKALQEYQKAQGIVSKGDPQSTGYGRLGPQTLKSVNSFISTSTGQPDTTVDKYDFAKQMADMPAQDGTGAVADKTTTTIADKITPEISQQIKDTETEEDMTMEEILANSTATDEQKEIMRIMFSAQSSFDVGLMRKIEAGFDAAEKLDEPYFKAQIRLAKDELARGFTKFEDELAFQEESLTRNLQQLREDTALAKERGSLEEQTQLAQLEKALGLKLESTRQNLATSGFTSSSRRARSEELLRETTGELRESTQRRFAQKREDLATGLKRGETGTVAELERLREITKSKKLDLGRSKEEYLGSKEAKGLGFNLLGDISGQMQADRQKSMRTFARSFIN